MHTLFGPFFGAVPSLRVAAVHQSCARLVGVARGDEDSSSARRPVRDEPMR